MQIWHRLWHAILNGVCTELDLFNEQVCVLGLSHDTTTAPSGITVEGLWHRLYLQYQMFYYLSWILVFTISHGLTLKTTVEGINPL